MLWVSLLANPWRLATGLVSSADLLRRAEKHLSKGSLKQARYEVLAAVAAAERAASAYRARGPLIDLVTLSETARRALPEVEHLVAAAEHSAAAARGTLEVAQTALRGPNKIISRDEIGEGVIDLDRIGEIGAIIGEVRHNVQEVASELAAVEPGDLPRAARDDVARGFARARSTERVLADAQVGFRLLPSILGAERKRTYLLGMQNNAELRGTGGAMLRFALLEIDQGRPRLLPSETVYDIDRERQPLFDIELPVDAWYVREIEDAHRFGNANWSPDWPLSARVSIAYGEVSEQPLPPVDGAILVDPIVMRELLPGAGAIELRSNRFISAKRVVPFLMYNAYSVYPNSGIRRKVLREVVDVFYESLLKPKRPTELVQGMGRSLARKHMQVWLGDPAEQAFVQRMNWDGGIEEARDSDYFYAVQQNVGGNKLNYFEEQQDELSLAVVDRDDVAVRARVTVTNGVFAPQPRYVLGDSGDEEERQALHRPMMNIYAPGRAQLGSCSVRGRRIDTPPPAVWAPSVPEHRERGKKVWSATLEVPPGESASFGCRYRVPDAVTMEGGRSVYRLTVQHQPRVRPETLAVRLVLPPEARAIEAAGWDVSGRALTWERRLEEDLVLEVSWRS